MRREMYRVFGIIVFGLVIVLGLLAAAHMIINLPIPEGKGAEWTGAFGTVATLIGTIWLATASERIRRNEARDSAIVTAAALQMKLLSMVHALQHAIDHFYDDTDRECGLQYGIHANLIQSAGSWSNEEILPLVVLPNHVCARLASARSLIEHCTREMLELETTQGYSWVQETKAFTDGKILAALIQSRDAVVFSLSECKRLTKTATHDVHYADV